MKLSSAPEVRAAARVQQPAQRADQAFDGGAVDLVFAAEVVQDFHLGGFGDGVPLVMGELEVSHRGAVFVLPARGPDEHVTRP
ncbi:hypothetical protein GCM10009733_098400 [Nonomuraea maheshkhaliensis]|uniref:Uncharacterized protein n=1 Tax=Nonomuraea maheshkhaliensis TaxID=419590 RepID=A0ABN2HDV3_9ACTN